MRVVWVDVYDNAQLRLDSSLTPAEQRNRQSLVTSAEPDENGKFKIKHLPNGFYEVEFGNHGMGGWNILSVLVSVDEEGTADKLCVNLSLESAGEPRSGVTKCGAK